MEHFSCRTQHCRGFNHRLLWRNPEQPLPSPITPPDDLSTQADGRGDKMESSAIDRRQQRREHREKLEAWDQTCELSSAEKLEEMAIDLARNVENHQRYVANANPERHPKHRAKLERVLKSYQEQLDIARDVLADKLGLRSKRMDELKAEEAYLADSIWFLKQRLADPDFRDSSDHEQYSRVESDMWRKANSLAVIKRAIEDKRMAN